MTRNKIYAIVEGHGEADRGVSATGRAAVPVLVGRLLHDLQSYALFPDEKYSPFRISYGELFRGDKLERAVRLHGKYADCAALLVLLDLDDGCPKDKAQEIVGRIRRMGKLDFSVVVVCARREYESWFLASLETIYGDRYDGDPEAIRDAKGWLRTQYRYRQTHHQALCTQKIDIALAQKRSRSFRRMYHAIEQVVHAVADDETIISPLETPARGS
jgi:hypothetical protein